MVFRRVSECIYADTETAGLGNAGVMLLDDRVVVVDAQFVEPARLLRDNIEKVSQRKITHLLLTHSHSDHVFGAEVFRDCEIVAHSSLKTRMEELIKTSWSAKNLQTQIVELKKTDPQKAARFSNVHIVLPTKTFQHRFVLGDDGPSIEMIHTGGHTADSSIVYFPRGKAVFAGDLIFAGVYPFGSDPTADPDIWVEALCKIRSLNPEVIIPGHGPICGIDEVNRYEKYITGTKSAMIRLIEEGKSEGQVISDPSLPQFYQDGAGSKRASSLAQWFRVWSRRGTG